MTVFTDTDISVAISADFMHIVAHKHHRLGQFGEALHDSLQDLPSTLAPGENSASRLPGATVPVPLPPGATYDQNSVSSLGLVGVQRDPPHGSLSDLVGPGCHRQGLPQPGPELTRGAGPTCPPTTAAYRGWRHMSEALSGDQARCPAVQAAQPGLPTRPTLADSAALASQPRPVARLVSLGGPRCSTGVDLWCGAFMIGAR